MLTDKDKAALERMGWRFVPTGPNEWSWAKLDPLDDSVFTAWQGDAVWSEDLASLRELRPLWERPKSAISLHGLGFLQVQLGGNLRLHVWHPELPRRRCAEHSSIHDHRFSFESTVLVGVQVNHEFTLVEHSASPSHDGPLYAQYKHEGPRTRFGNRPWVRQRFCGHMVRTATQTVEAGETYRMEAYRFHSTEPGGDGRVATLMRKTWEGEEGATSTCVLRHGLEPDVDFDRYQMPEGDMWDVVANVLGDR